MQILNNRQKNQGRGFTLMELTVVVSLILILLGVGMTNYITQLKRSRDGRRKSDLEQVRAALEMIRTDCGSYNYTPPWGSEWTVDCGSGDNTYIQVTPQDPLNPRYNYVFSYSAADDTYSLCTYLEKGSGDVGCGSCGSGENCNYKITNP